MNKKIDIIGVETDLGASTNGTNMAARAIRYGGLCQGLKQLGLDVYDLGNIFPMCHGATLKNMKNFEQIIEINQRLYQIILKSLTQGHFPVILGGDHSIAAGSISAVSKYYQKIGIIWIDAHGDWNNEESTLSGNMHGMPFSAICGYGPNCLTGYGDTPALVDIKRCVQIGGRDIDTLERQRMKEAGVTVFPINVIDKLGIDEVMMRAIEIAGAESAGIYLSFDIDAIDSQAAPGTGTVVHSGLTVREAFLAVESLADSGKLLAMDMVEVNPILDIRNKTAILASELIQSALGKSVY